MDEECLARGIYTFEEGDAVVIASTAAYYKFFQNVQGGQGSYKVRQRAQSSAPDAADADATDIVPLPSPWPSDPIYTSIGKVVQVRPTGHVDVIFECGRDGTGNPQEPPETPHSRVERTDGIENTTYTVVPDAVVKVPQLLEGDLVKVVHDIRAGRCMKTTNDFRVYPKMLSVAFVVEGSDGNADNISVTRGFDIECSTSLKLELIARPAVGDFRATLKDYCSSWSFEKKWFRGMQDFMQELPAVNMEPRRMASPYAPGNVVKVSADLTMAIRRHVEELASGIEKRISDYINLNERHDTPIEAAFPTVWERTESLKRYGKILQVNSSGYVTVLFTDGTVWHIQSSFLEIVHRSKGCGSGEGTLFPEVLSTKVDTLIHDVLSPDNVEVS